MFTSRLSHALAIVQPRLDAGRRHADGVRRFLDGQPAEEPEFDDARLLRIEARERGQGVIERQQIDRLPLVSHQRLVQGDAGAGAAPFRGGARARPLDENSTHGDRGNRQKVGTALPILLLVFRQPQIGLVNERRCLKRRGALSPHVATGQPPKLVVDDGHELRDGFLVPCAGPPDYLGDGLCRARCHNTRLLRRRPSRARPERSVPDSPQGCVSPFDRRSRISAVAEVEGEEGDEVSTAPFLFSLTYGSRVRTMAFIAP